jgi:hypothetical protein
MVRIPFFTCHAKAENAADRFVIEINLADRQIVGGPPIRVRSKSGVSVFVFILMFRN